jgi:hypothetical protein
MGRTWWAMGDNHGESWFHDVTEIVEKLGKDPPNPVLVEENSPMPEWPLLLQIRKGEKKRASNSLMNCQV